MTNDVASISFVRNSAEPLGYELGRQLARFCDEAEPKARLRFPELTPRCAPCAFRAGNHLASGSLATQATALKCVMEGVEFYCHDVHRDGALCSGWAMMMLAKDEPDFIECPWPFVDGADDPVAPANDDAIAIAIELAIDRARQMLSDPDLDFATRKRSKAFLDAARAEGFV